jgi:Holliday junction DNA helicase RuvA
MIGRLRGLVIVKQPPYLLLEVQGVGYELEAPMSTFYGLPETGSEAVLHTHLVVREDSHVLYAFGTDTDRTLFRALIRVSGVGPKLALAILSGMDAPTFARSVQQADIAGLTRLPGIGKKTAERLVVEMRDRLSDLESATARPRAGGTRPGRQPSAAEDAMTALEALGYRPVEARRLVSAVECEGVASEEIIRRALQAAMKP